MATGERNETEYVKFFNQYYTKAESKKYPSGITVKFIDNERKVIELKNVTNMKQVGESQQKTDILVTANKTYYRISIKDNSSIYWGSEDTYIRQTRGEKIRQILKSLADGTKDAYVVYDKKLRRYKLRTPLAVLIDAKAKNKTLFGSERKLQKSSNDTTVDVVIRGEILQTNVAYEPEKKINGRNIVPTLIYNVKRIYRTIADIPNDEEPVLYIYSSDERVTFNETVTPGASLIGEFTGIRGQFRSKKNVEDLLILRGGITLV
jgi:hypothetical protein